MAKFKLDSVNGKKPHQCIDEKFNKLNPQLQKITGKTMGAEVYVKDEVKRARICSLVFNAAQLLLILFTLFFIGSKILYGGFYSVKYHGIAMGLLIGGSAVLIVSLIMFFVIFRVHRKIGKSIARWCLSAMSLVIAIYSMIILGISAYLVVAICIFVAALTVELISFFKTYGITYNWEIPSTVITIAVSVVAITLSTISSFGVMPISPDGACVDINAFERTARYDIREDNTAELKKVMLTAYDAFNITTDKEYAVPDTVRIDGKDVPVTAIGSEAFVGVCSFDRISLPESVTYIQAGAFKDSSVSEIIVCSEELTAADGFNDSEIKTVRVLAGAGTRILTAGNSVLSSDVTVAVPKNELNSYRKNNPEIAARIAPVLAENEICVNFNLSAPNDSGEISKYIESVILTKDSSGKASVALPYSSFKTVNDRYGKHWVYRNGGRTFRLFSLDVNGEAVNSESSTLTLSKSTDINIEWKEMFTVYADYTSVGGELTLLTEFASGDTGFTVPSGVKHDLKPGYTCYNWYSSADLSGEIISQISDCSKNYVVYPKWKLDAASVKFDNFSTVYDGSFSTIRPIVSHEAADVVFEYTWKKDSTLLIKNRTNEIKVKNVSDSALYAFTVTARDSEGQSASFTEYANIKISPAKLSIKADAKTITYGEENVPLTYKVSGLISPDVISGAISRESGNNAGSYSITLGDLSAGENYSIDFTSAQYVINKADYDMSGITFEDESAVYDRQNHSIEINGTLPVGLDGIRVTVSYSGTAINAGENELTANFATASANYNVPESMKAIFTIEKKPLLISAYGLEATYGSNLAFSYMEEGLIDGDTISGSLAKTGTDDVGEYDIILGTLTAGPNYEISYTGAVCKINKANYDMSGITFEDQSFIYNKTAQHAIISGELPTGLDGIKVTVTYTGSATYVSDSQVLTTAIFATESGNYEIPAAMTAYTAITPRTITVTAEGKTITYGDENLPLTYKVENLVEGDSLTGELVRELGDNAGTYEISLGTVSADENYAIDFTSATYTINKATYDMSGIKFEDMTVTYDGAEKTIVVSGELPVGLDGIAVTVSYTGAATNVSETEIIATFATESVNYNAPEVMLANLYITPKTIQITAHKIDTVYGEAEKELTYDVVGLVTGDALVGELARESGDNAGTYAISLGTLSAGDNYTVDFTPESYNIAKATYDMSGIMFEDQSFIYNKTAQHAIISGELPEGLDGIKVTVTYTGSATYVSDSQVLTTAIFATESGNYEIPEAMTAYTAITPRTITVTADEKTITYGDENVSLTYAVENFVEGDSITGELVREFGDNAGTYEISLGTVSADENYTVDFTPADYIINKAAYDMSGITFENQIFIYNKTAQHAIISGELPEGLDGIKVTVTYTGSAIYVSDSQVLTTAIFATESENYEIPVAMTAYTTVIPRTIVVTAEGKTITYGDENLPLTYKVENLVEGDSITGELVREPGDNAGTYEISLGTVSADENYAIDFASASYIINKATYDMSGITFEDQSFIYNKTAQHAIISGELPEGLDGIKVTVTYTGSATYVSDSQVLTTAIFATESENYEIPEAMTAYTAITPRTITVTAEGKTITYGDENVSLTYVVENLVEGDSLTGELVRELGDNAGTYAISLGTLSAGDNYTVDFTPATYTINKAAYDMSGITFEDQSFIYNKTAQHAIISGELPEGLDGIKVTVTYTGSATYVSDSQVLTTAIFATESENYEIPEAMTAYTAITPRTITVTADEKVITYGDENVPLTYNIENLIEGDTVTVELVREAGDNAGVYAISIGTLAVNDNYTADFTPATYTINKATYDMSGIWFEDAIVTYNGVEKTIVIYGELPVGLDGIAVTVSYTGIATNVSETEIVANFATESENYETPEAMTATLRIVPKYIQVTANDVEAVYGESEKELTYSVNGLIGDDSLTGSLVREAGDDVGTYAILLGTLSAGGNYKIEFTPATYTISPAESVIDVSEIQLTYTYNGEIQTVTGAKLNHNEAELVYANNTFRTVSEGNGRVVEISVPASENYNAATVSVTITVEKATVEVPVPEKVEFDLSGEEIVFMTDDVNGLYTVSGGKGTDLGEYTAVLELVDASNYQWSDPSFDGNISWEIVGEYIINKLA